MEQSQSLPAWYIEKVIECLPRMVDLRPKIRIYRQLKKALPFDYLVCDHCKLLPEGHVDDTGCTQNWHTPFCAEGKIFFALSRLDSGTDSIDVIYVDHMYTLPTERHKGFGSQVMEIICKAADQTNTWLQLNAEAEADKPIDDHLLVKWYTRFGFDFETIERNGKKRDMDVKSNPAVRKPRSKD